MHAHRSGLLLSHRVRLRGEFIVSVLQAVLIVNCGGSTKFRVPGGSMEPNIFVGQTIEVDENAYQRAGSIRRGDVVVFRYSTTGRLFVQRVVGMPGERVSVTDGRVSINGVPIDVFIDDGDVVIENTGIVRYRINLTSPCGGSSSEVVVPAEALFLLGDNRCASHDSRHFGSVTFSAIRGKVVFPE